MSEDMKLSEREVLAFRKLSEQGAAEKVAPSKDKDTMRRQKTIFLEMPGMGSANGASTQGDGRPTSMRARSQTVAPLPP